MKIRYILFIVFVCMFASNIYGQDDNLTLTKLDGQTPTSTITVPYGESITDYYIIQTPCKNGKYIAGTLYIGLNSSNVESAIASVVISQDMSFNEKGIGAIDGIGKFLISIDKYNETKAYKLWFTKAESSIPYITLSTPYTITITPRPITIDYNFNGSFVKTYDGNTNAEIDNEKIITKLNTDYTKVGVLQGDESVIAVTASYKSKDVNTDETDNPVEVTFSLNANSTKAKYYELVDQTPKTFSGKINPKSLAISFDFSRPYDGTTDAKLENIEFTHQKNGDIIDGEVIKIKSVEGTLNDANASSTEQTVTINNITYDDNYHHNYNITFNGVGTISKKDITLPQLEFKKIYDGTTNATLNNLKTKEFETGVNNEKITITAINNFNFSDKNFSEDNMEVTNGTVTINSDNYNVSLTSPSKGKINQQPISLSLDFSKKYDGTTNAKLENIEFTHQKNNVIVDGEVIKIKSVEGTFSNANASTTTQGVTINKNSITYDDNAYQNYDITFNGVGEIAQRPITKITVSYDKDKIYDATNEVLNFSTTSIEGAIEADKENFNITANYTNQNANNVSIEFSISPLESIKQNYSSENTEIFKSNEGKIGSLDATWTCQYENQTMPTGKISPCKISYDVKNFETTKIYNSSDNVESFNGVENITAQTNGNNNPKTFTSSENYKGYFFENDNIEITFSAKYDDKNQGENKTITITPTVNSSNYTVDNTIVPNCTITPSTITLTQKISPINKQYDETSDVFVYDENNNIIYDFEKIFNISCENDYSKEIHLVIENLKYHSINVVVDDNYIEYRVLLEGNDFGNYNVVKPDNLTGEIKPIIPTAKWKVDNSIITEDNITLLPADKIGDVKKLYAALDVDYNYKNLFNSATYQYYDDVTSSFIDITSETSFTPNQTYKIRAFFSYNAPDRNFENSTPIIINVTFTQLKLNGYFSDAPEVYGLTIGQGNNAVKKFNITNTGIENISDLVYTYYLDGEKVDLGFRPKVGKHKLQCVVSDRLNNFETLSSEEIELNITPKLIYIIPLETEYENEWVRYYDGTTNFYDYQIKTPAQINTYIFPDDDVSLATEAYYETATALVPQNVHVIHSLVGEDAFCYDFAIKEGEIGWKEGASTFVFPGKIKPCMPIVEFQDYTKVYGESEIGKDIVATASFNGQDFTNKGTFEFYQQPIGKNETIQLGDGEMLYAGEYKDVFVFFIPDDSQNYEKGMSDNHTITILPKPIQASGVTIADKYYDGTKKISDYQVKFIEPALEGVLDNDKNIVKVEYDATKLEYPSIAIGNYKNISVDLSLVGAGIDNYTLENKTVTAESNILPFVFEYNIEPDENNVYQLVYGSSVLGRDLKVINELFENQYVKYSVVDIDKTNQMLIPNTYKITVQLFDNDYLVQSEDITVKVAKLKLIASEPQINHVKLFDGTSKVIQTGENSFLTNLVAGDDVKISAQKQQYDSPNVGTNKTIVVEFTIFGSWENKYFEPDGYIFTDGVITNKDLKISSLGVIGDICPSSDVQLSYIVDEGIPDKISINYSDQALEQGFQNIEMQISKDAFGPQFIDMKIPNKTKAGKYSARLLLESSTSKLDTSFSFVVNYDSSYIVAKFNDVVALDNSGLEFQGYQWYKDGKMFEGEVKQFFNDLPYLHGRYSAKVMTMDGNYANVCPHFFDKRLSVSKKSSKTVTIYPNPARENETVNIVLNGFEEYTDAVIYIYNSSGVLIKKLSNLDYMNTVNLSNGNYTGIVLGNNYKLNFKLIVKK